MSIFCPEILIYHSQTIASYSIGMYIQGKKAICYAFTLWLFVVLPSDL